MFQESVDRSHGSARSDLVLFILLLVAFFTVGAVVVMLENSLESKLPRYIFIGAVLACLYLVYRLRIVGYRYTIFYEEPKAVYDTRFDDMIMHEDYPYPVGTVVFERIVSAKGTILFTVDKSEIEALAKPGEDGGIAADSTFNAACRKPEKAYSLFFRKNGKMVRLYFDPSEEFLGYLNRILSAPASTEE